MLSLFLRPNSYPLQLMLSAFSQVKALPHSDLCVTVSTARLDYFHVSLSLVCWSFSRALRAVPLGFPFLSFLMYRDAVLAHGCQYLRTILSIQSQPFEM